MRSSIAISNIKHNEITALVGISKKKTISNSSLILNETFGQLTRYFQNWSTYKTNGNQTNNIQNIIKHPTKNPTLSTSANVLIMGLLQKPAIE
jgi:hypothetical protein